MRPQESNLDKDHQRECKKPRRSGAKNQYVIGQADRSQRKDDQAGLSDSRPRPKAYASTLGGPDPYIATRSRASGAGGRRALTYYSSPRLFSTGRLLYLRERAVPVPGESGQADK